MLDAGRVDDPGRLARHGRRPDGLDHVDLRADPEVAAEPERADHEDDRGDRGGRRQERPADVRVTG